MFNKYLKKIKDNYKTILVSLLIIFIFFVMYRIIPMMYDGWIGKYYYNVQDGLLSYIRYVFVDHYNWINGRIASNLICGILESFPSELPLDLFNASMIIGIVLMINKTIKNENEKKLILGILLFASSILLISSDMKKDVLFYANAAYVVPILLVLVFYYCYNKFITKPNNKLVVIMSVIGFCIGTWMENIAFGFAATISLIALYYFIKNKPLKWNIAIPAVITDLSLVFMLLSPGLRTNRDVIDNSVSLTFIIRRNLITFYRDIISNNLLLIILLSLFGIILLLTNKKKYKFYKFMLIPMFFLFITAMLTIINETFYIGLFNNIRILYPITVGDASFKIILFMAFVILGVFVYLIFNSKNQKFLTYLLFICAGSIAPMCITPTTGARISFISYMLLLLIVLVLFFEIDIKNKKIDKYLTILVCFLTVVSIDKTILTCRRISEVTNKRDKIIAEVVELQELNDWDYDEYVVLPFYKYEDIRYQGVVNMDSFHYPYFLQASGLDPRTKVVFSNSNLVARTYIEDDNMNFEMISETNKNDKFKYIVQYSSNNTEFVTVEESDWIKDNEYSYDVDKKPGYYKYIVYIKQNKIEQEIDGYFVLYVE